MKIYISSTFRDLEVFRDSLIETVLLLQHQYQLVCPMEHMIPGSANPILEQCLEYVRSADIYVLVIGKLYGSIAPGTDLSYTHHEYLTAKANPQKIVIPLFASPDCETLRDIETDNPAAFQSFTELVRKNNLTFKTDFTNPIHLAYFMTLALFPKVAKSSKMSMNMDVRYNCNRTTQKSDFMLMKRNASLNLYAIVCNAHDKPEYFNRRMALSELGLFKEYVGRQLTSRKIIGNTASYDIHRARFVEYMLDDLYDKGSNYPHTFSECFKIFKEYGLSHLYIDFTITKEEKNNKVLVKSLKRFLAELYEVCDMYKITVFFVAVFEFADDEFQDRSMLKMLANKKIYQTNVLEAFPKINSKTLKEWLSDYITAKDDYEIDQDLKPYFQETKEYTMLDSMPVMKQLIEANSTNTPFLR